MEVFSDVLSERIETQDTHCGKQKPTGKILMM